MIHSRKKGAHIGWMLLLLLVFSMGIASVQVSAAPVSTAAKSADGKIVTKGSDKYYRYKDGSYAKNTWIKIGKRSYYFLKSGRMAVRRMQKLSGKTYYFKANGVRAESIWIKKGGRYYYFDKNGVRAENKWVKRNGKYYYVGENGAIVTKSWVDNHKYYVGANGTRVTNTVKDGYYLNASGKNVIKVFNGDYIFVGDSRMVGMQSAVAPSDTLYIAKSGQGYAWLKSTAGVQLRYYLKTNPNVKVVLALGVNDLKNVNSYITYYKKLIKEFPKTKFYVLSVNPVNEKIRRYHIKNSSIESFNKKMYVAFRSRYVNTYRQMKQEGFGTKDGLHYLEADYQKLYATIISKIQ